MPAAESLERLKVFILYYLIPRNTYIIYLFSIYKFSSERCYGIKCMTHGGAAASQRRSPLRNAWKERGAGRIIFIFAYYQLKTPHPPRLIRPCFTISQHLDKYIYC